MPVLCARSSRSARRSQGSSPPGARSTTQRCRPNRLPGQARASPAAGGRPGVPTALRPSGNRVGPVGRVRGGPGGRRRRLSAGCAGFAREGPLPVVPAGSRSGRHPPGREVRPSRVVRPEAHRTDLDPISAEGEDPPSALMGWGHGSVAAGPGDGAAPTPGSQAASCRIRSYRSDLPSKPMPGSSGITMCPSCTSTPSGKPPNGWKRSG